MSFFDADNTSFWIVRFSFGHLTICLTGSGDFSGITSISSLTLKSVKFGARNSAIGDVGGVKKSGVGGVTVPTGGVEIPVGGVGKVKIWGVGGIGGGFGVFLSSVVSHFGGGM